MARATFRTVVRGRDASQTRPRRCEGGHVTQVWHADDAFDPSLLEPNPFHVTSYNVDPRTTRSRVLDGAAFIRSVPDTVPAIWGRDGSVLWAEGEGLMLVGPDGVGKTSVGQQLVLSRIGVRGSLLDLPVAPVA